jgi:hypothetical protein
MAGLEVELAVLGSSDEAILATPDRFVGGKFARLVEVESSGRTLPVTVGGSGLAPLSGMPRIANAPAELLFGFWHSTAVRES